MLLIAGYNIIRVHKFDGSYEPPVPTSSLASFSRRKPCTSRFAVLCRWPTITPGFSCGIFRWRGKWLNVDQDLPSSAVQASEECNHEFFPNVHKLLRILCTLPITLQNVSDCSAHCGD